jgi:class 3 adenylate cyclase/YHS domain-containing protein
MEQDIAILIADLAGYTALTETHGAATAADTIDKFHEIVRRSLAGQSRLHERVGDEVMIVAEHPRDLLNTAAMLIHHCATEHLFLQVHGGLHYGPVLNRNDHFFGSTLNLTSRIAAKANKGRFWCSPEFLQSLGDRSDFIFTSMGRHTFKNVREEMELFELVIDQQQFFHIDPVCRMVICNKETAIQHPQDADVYFCSAHCLEIYEKGLP